MTAHAKSSHPRLAAPVDAYDAERLASTTAAVWVSWWANELREQGRTMSGGWPGTMREARGRVLVALASCHPRPALDDDQLLALIRAVNDAARGGWLAAAQPDLEP